MDSGVLFLVVIFGGIAILMLWPKIIASVVPVHTLSDEYREAVWIDLKKKVLVTDSYAKSSGYEYLYNRCSDLLSTFIMRHQHYPLGIEAKWGDRGASEVFSIFIEQQREHAAAPKYYRINHSLDLNNAEENLIFYACWFAYIGGRSKYLPGEIMSDHSFLCRAIDYLIRECASMDAVFLKGFVLKYGLGVSGKPDLRAARAHLERAAQSGVGAAAFELQYFNKHLALEGITSVHAQDYSWMSSNDSQHFCSPWG